MGTRVVGWWVPGYWGGGGYRVLGGGSVPGPLTLCPLTAVKPCLDPSVRVPPGPVGSLMAKIPGPGCLQWPHDEIPINLEKVSKSDILTKKVTNLTNFTDFTDFATFLTLF